MTSKEILAGLWIGDNNIYLNTGFHSKKNIEYSINCNYNKSLNEIIDFLLSIIKLIDKKLQKCQNILLYSKNIQYAAITAGAYLIKYGNLSSKSVMNIIYNKYIDAFKDEFYKKILIEFEKRLI